MTDHRTDPVRIDKWLWASRMFKTRSAATAACQSGKVKLNGSAIKPSRNVMIGDEMLITRQHHKQSVRVTGMALKRVGAKLAAELFVDITPESEIEREKQAQVVNSAFRKTRYSDTGKPSKRDRRILQKFKEEHE